MFAFIRKYFLINNYELNVYVLLSSLIFLYYLASFSFKNIENRFLNYSNNAPSMISENKIIKSISLDELVKTKKINPKFIKIDVEGAEFSVLQGMRNILENFTPIIMIEKQKVQIIPLALLFQQANFLKNQEMETLKTLQLILL